MESRQSNVHGTPRSACHLPCEPQRTDAFASRRDAHTEETLGSCMVRSARLLPRLAVRAAGSTCTPCLLSPPPPVLLQNQRWERTPVAAEWAMCLTGALESVELGRSPRQTWYIAREVRGVGGSVGLSKPPMSMLPSSAGCVWPALILACVGKRLFSRAYLLTLQSGRR